MTTTPATPDLHICIATGENLANLIPALQCGAKEVWVLETPTMRRQNSARYLAAALEAHHIEVHCEDFVDDDVAGMHKRAEQIAEKLDGRAVTINLSGGNKIMTLALVQTLAGQLATGPSSTRLVYTDTVHRRLDWLEGQSARSEPMRSVLKVNDVLRAQGYARQEGSATARENEWRARANERKALTYFMGDEARSLGRFFGTLNWLAHNALNEPKGPWRPRQELDFPPAGRPADLLRLADQGGLLTWDGDTQVVLADARAAEYLGGGWVEEYAGFKVGGTGGDGGWAPRLLVEHSHSGATNELDAVLVHGNRMLIVECKSAKPGSKEVSDWIYKASQLARRIGGQLCQPLLLSARQLEEGHLQRAREYRVDVLDGQKIAALPKYLDDWKRV